MAVVEKLKYQNLFTSEGFIPMDVHWVRMIQTTFQLSVRSFQVPTVLQGSFSILFPHNFPHLTAMFPILSRPCQVGAAAPAGEGE